MSRRFALLAPVVLALLGACSQDDDGCLWEVDDLLRHARVRLSEDRVDCDFAVDGMRSGLECFLGAPPERGAELLVWRCVDCLAVTTFVSTPRSEIYAIDQYASTFDGSPPRSARLTRCSAVRIENGPYECVPGEELYSCREPESAWEMSP
jgi:hypothetical protein